MKIEIVKTKGQTFFLTDWWNLVSRNLKSLSRSLEIFEFLYTILERFFENLCCFFTVMNKLKIFKDLCRIFLKIFQDLHFLKIKYLDGLFKVFWRLCKDLYNFFIEMKKPEQ